MFVFLALCSVLFLLKDTVQPIPSLVDFFHKIEESYDQKIGLAKDNYNENVPQSTSDNIKQLFQSYFKSNQAFLSDLRFRTALNSASKQYFDDFEYLIQEYFHSVPYFKDFILLKNNISIYKHRNFYTLQALRFTCVIDQPNKISFQIVYDAQLLADLAEKSEEPLLISFQKKRYQSPSLEKISSKMKSKEVVMLLNTNTGVHKLSKNRFLRTVVINDVASTPIIVSSVFKKRGGFNFLKIFYYLFLPLIWFLIFLLDQFILKRLSFQKKIDQYKKQFLSSDQNNTIHDIDESLNWFDRFIKIETINEIDTRVSRNKHNTTENNKKN
ncbi:MAG: hypothetical protein ACRCTJ_04290 [Brevinema sp.]